MKYCHIGRYHFYHRFPSCLKNCSLSVSNLLIEDKILDFQFSFHNKHATLEQVRVTTEIERALEEKKFCSTVFLDVSQAFDCVWHKGLIHKLSHMLPGNLCLLIQSYLANRTFRVLHEDTRSQFYTIKTGV